MLQSRLVKLAVMPMTRSLIAFLSLYMFPLHQASSFGFFFFFWSAPISCSWKPGGPLAIPVLTEDSRLLPDFALSSLGVFYREWLWGFRRASLAGAVSEGCEGVSDGFLLSCQYHFGFT